MTNAVSVQILVEKGKELFDAPKKFIVFTKDKKADSLLNDLIDFPHAFVLGCVMDRQVRAERAWMIPYLFSKKLNGFQFSSIQKLSQKEIHDLMAQPEPLHRFVDKMSHHFHDAINLIADKYDGNAANIWADTPPSAELVYRFLEFSGVGPKIGTMATNILARDFKIPLRDYYSIDISVDVQVRRVFERLGIVEPKCSVEQIVYRVRALHPEFPGLLDFPAWEVGRKWCRPISPDCPKCYMQITCPSAK